MRSASSVAGLVVVAAMSALAGLGCMEPLQSGGVVIIGDPNERIAAMCRFRHRDSTSELCGVDLDAGGDPGFAEGGGDGAERGAPPESGAPPEGAASSDAAAALAPVGAASSLDVWASDVSPMIR